MNHIQKLKAIQKYSEKTQTELAELLHVSFPTLNSWINGKSTPRQKALESIETLYLSYVGQLDLDNSVLREKEKQLKTLQKKHKNPFKTIMSRKDLYDEFVLKLTYNTNSIEGSTFNEPEVRAVLFDDVTISNKSVREHQEAKNHQGALGLAMRWLRDEDGIITEELIKNLHAILMNGILHNAGEYRTHSVRIAGANIPTSNPMKIEVNMKDFIKKLNKKTSDPILHIAVIHSEFEKIHPFSDGNGRIGRLIMVLQAFRGGLAPVLVEREKKIAYYNNLQESQLKEKHLPLISFIYDSVFTGYRLIEK